MVGVTRRDFDAFLRTKPAGTDPPQYLSDLYLAYAASRGDAAAITSFMTSYAGVLESVRSRFGARAPTRAELQVEIQNHLFVPRENGDLRILGYSAQSELQSWLRVVVTRFLLNRLESQKAEETFDDQLLEGLELGVRSPEYQLQREESRMLFRAAFANAVGTLAARDRQLLRLSFVEGLSIDDIGALYGMHRATAFRHVQKASEQLALSLQKQLRTHLKLSATEYDRWCASIRGSVDLSLGRIFTSEE